MSRLISNIYESDRQPKATLPKSQLATQLVTGLSSVYILSEPATSYTVARGVQTYSPAALRDTSLDTIIDCLGYDNFGNANRGVGFVSAIASAAAPLTLFGTAIAYTYAYGISIVGNAYTYFANAQTISSGEVLFGPLLGNWLKWSDIGSADFTIWKGNVAGERPLDWKGWIYSVRQLGGFVVAYGENGVSILKPSGTAYGLQTINRTGLKGRYAVSGDDTVHFFIDLLGQLFMISGEPNIEKLDYSEYLSLMTNPVLSWDEVNNLLYICDGTYGYVYNPKNKSLGSGPVNITGIGSQSGTTIVTSSGVIATPIFEICTDTYDFSSRKPKNVEYIELGTNLTENLECAIDYRLSKEGDFYTSAWKIVNPTGICYIPCYGVEFRFRLRAYGYEEFELDYIKVHGHLHGYSSGYVKTSSF